MKETPLENYSPSVSTSQDVPDKVQNSLQVLFCSERSEMFNFPYSTGFDLKSSAEIWKFWQASLAACFWGEDCDQ